MVYIDHHSPHHQKGFYGGLALAGASLGTLVGSLVGSLLYTTLAPKQLHWWFRTPFLCGWIVAVAASCLHSKECEAGWCRLHRSFLLARGAEQSMMICVITYRSHLKWRKSWKKSNSIKEKGIVPLV